MVAPPVLPTQIFESAASLAIAAVCLLWVHGRKRYDGQVFVAFLALYAVARFLLEFLRDDDRGGLLGLSTSQLIGVGLVAAAIAIHVRALPPAGARGARAVPRQACSRGLPKLASRRAGPYPVGMSFDKRLGVAGLRRRGARAAPSTRPAVDDARSAAAVHEQVLQQPVGRRRETTGRRGQRARASTGTGTGTGGSP